MTKQERITKNIKEDKNLLKIINSNSYNEGNEAIENFIDNANRYIKAIESGRMCCIIESVSASGMSRTLKFMECSGKGQNFNYLNFFQLFRMLGYSPKNSQSNVFRVHGCGMDMVFNTNYNNIHTLQRLGFMTKTKCNKLAQCTPNLIA